MSIPATADTSVQPILVPIDFEPAARSALVFAARLASGKGAPLKILHVVHEPTDRPNYYQRHDGQDVVQPIEALAERMLNAFLADVYHSDPTLRVLETPDILLVKGLPATRIPEVAALVGAAQIVMGHTKACGMLANLFASLSDRVADSCDIPVTVICPNGKPEVVESPAQKPLKENVVLGA